MGLANSKQEAFWEACGFGATPKVRKFIDEGINVNWVSYTHNSCAIHVASQGKPEIVKMLIDAKCDVNVLDDRGNLALHHAAMKGHDEIMQMLLDAGSHIDTQDKNGWTSLINAAYWCQAAAIEVLLKNKCDPHLLNKDERTALHETCRSQSEDQEGLGKIARLLIEAGSDINAKSSDLGEADFTPLMFAAYHGHLSVAQALIDAKCEITAQGSNKWTALHWAADRGNREVVQLFLAAGLDPLTEGRRGELALDRAQDNEIKEILKKATEEGRSRLEEAARELQEELDSSEPKILAENKEKEKDEMSSSSESEPEQIEVNSLNSPAVETKVTEEEKAEGSTSLSNIESESDERSKSSKQAASIDEEQETEESEKSNVSGAFAEDAVALTTATTTEKEKDTSESSIENENENTEDGNAKDLPDVTRSENVDISESNKLTVEKAKTENDDEPKNVGDPISESNTDSDLSPPPCEETISDVAEEDKVDNDVTDDIGALEIDKPSTEAEIAETLEERAKEAESHDEDDEMFDENAFNEGDYTDDLKDNLSD